MDLQHLRAATRPEHEATEAAMPLLGADLTIERYGSVLRCIVPLLQSWECWSAEHAPLRLRPLLAPRQRSHLIEADLRVLTTLSSTPGEAADEPHGAPPPWPALVLEPGRTQADADPGEFEAGFLGALYVFEGSTLGGRFLAKQVEAALGLVPGQGSAYFQGHGAATGPMWREVTEQIAAVPDENAECLIRAAGRTFGAFRQALEGCVEGPFPARMASTAMISS